MTNEPSFETAARRAGLKAHYDGLGGAQDDEAWYEDPAFDALIAISDFGSASSVLEIGCGTGRFAERLLSEALPDNATYLGIDLSPVMVGLTRQRLVRFGARCRVLEADAIEGLAVGDASFDRVVATFVLDLMSTGETTAVLAEARRVLKPDGFLCAASMARGQTVGERFRNLGWRLVHAIAPLKVGGCRPLSLQETLSKGWISQGYVRRTIGNCAVASMCARPDSTV